MFLKDSEMSKKAQVVIKEIGIIGKDISRLKPSLRPRRLPRPR
jgi:hypothetical protein